MFILLVIGSIITMITCNNDLMGDGEYRDGRSRKTIDKSSKVSVDSTSYVDFTVEKYNAKTWKREDVLYELGGYLYKNGNSTIKINRVEGTIEISSDRGFYNGKENCQIYGKYSLDILGASSDCLYIRRNPKYGGVLIVDNVTFNGDQIPDLLTCIPLYGYSKNRIEVSSVMRGFILMPSGTYWKK